MALFFNAAVCCGMHGASTTINEHYFLSFLFSRDFEFRRWVRQGRKERRLAVTESPHPSPCKQAAGRHPPALPSAAIHRPHNQHKQTMNNWRAEEHHLCTSSTSSGTDLAPHSVKNDNDVIGGRDSWWRGGYSIRKLQRQGAGVSICVLG